MYSEGVLFLLITIEMEHIQAIGFSLSEQSLLIKYDKALFIKKIELFNSSIKRVKSIVYFKN